MRKTFVVGKLTGRTAEILLLEGGGDIHPGTASGPRMLQALVRSLAPLASASSSMPPLPAALACPTTVH